MTVFGQDASNHNGPLAYRDGLDFYVHKLTDGNGFYLDPYYQSHMTIARDHGIPVLGAYHVLHGNVSVTDQADWMIAKADALTPWWKTWDYWFWMVDAEPFDYLRAPSIPEINNFTAAVYDRAPRCVLGYLAAWHYGNGVQGLNVPFFANNYGANIAAPYRDLYPGDDSPRWYGGGRKGAFLQYGSRAVIAGQGNCDADAFPGTLDDLKDFIAQGGDAMPSAEEVAAAVWAQMINSPSLEYNQPAAEWLKWTKDNNNALNALNAAVQSLPGSLASEVAKSLAANPDFVAALAAALGKAPEHTHPVSGQTGGPVSP